MRVNGAAIRAIRERSGLLVRELAEQAGISQPAMTNIELGNRQPTPPHAVRIAAALKCDLAAILADPKEAP